MIRSLRYMAALLLVITAGSCSADNEQSGTGDPRIADASARMQMASEETVAPLSTTPDENGWYHNWDAGMAQARELERPVIVDFYADWCTWCKVMDEETFSDAAIKKQFAEGWVTIKIDTEDTQHSGTYKDNTMTYRELAGAFGVTGLPSYVFIDKNGEPVNMVTGYREKEPFAIILDFFKDEIYKLDEDAQKEFLDAKGMGSS